MYFSCYLPGRCLPLVDGCSDEEDVVPELLQHLDLLPALLQQTELGNLHLEQCGRILMENLGEVKINLIRFQDQFVLGCYTSYGKFRYGDTLGNGIHT